MLVPEDTAAMGEVVYLKSCKGLMLRWRGDSKPSPGWFSLEMSSSGSHSIREAEKKKEFDISERNYVLWNLQLRW